MASLQSTQAPPAEPARDRFRSLRTRHFTESVIREMTRLALRHGAVNLAQGFPDFPAPEALKEAARDAISRDYNQYAITWGAKSLRDAIAAKYRRTYGLEFDPEREITVCCGATEGMIASLTGRHQSRRRGRHLRALLRKLRARYETLRRRAALCTLAPAGLELRSRRAAPRFFAAHQSHHSEFAQQSHRQRLFAR